MKFHTRYTPYDISGYTFEWLDTICDKLIVAYEDKTKQGDPTEPHYHIYGEVEMTDDTIRNHLHRCLKIPKVGRGQANKYYATQWNWKDPSYVCKYDDIRVVKGFTEPEILRLAVEGKEKYLKKKPETTFVINVEPKAKKSVSKDNEIINELYEWYMTEKANRNEFDGIPSRDEIIREACKITRRYHKGINPFKVRDYVNAVMFDSGDYSAEVVKKIKSLL